MTDHPELTRQPPHVNGSGESEHVRVITEAEVEVAAWAIAEVDDAEWEEISDRLKWVYISQARAALEAVTRLRSHST